MSKSREEVALEILKAIIANPAITTGLRMLPTDYMETAFKLADEFVAQAAGPPPTGFVGVV